MNLQKIYWILLFVVFGKCIVLNIAKLDSYGVTKNSLKLILNYLNRREQMTKIGLSSAHGMI